MNQLVLALDDATQLRSAHDDGSYPDGFFDWVCENWHIYTEFCALARTAIRRGVTHWSADAICHVLRWETAIRERGQFALKINNNATAGLARLAMARESELKDFFSTRTPPARREAYRFDGEQYGEQRAVG